MLLKSKAHMQTCALQRNYKNGNQNQYIYQITSQRRVLSNDHNEVRVRRVLRRYLHRHVRVHTLTFLDKETYTKSILSCKNSPTTQLPNMDKYFMQKNTRKVNTALPFYAKHDQSRSRFVRCTKALCPFLEWTRSWSCQTTCVCLVPWIDIGVTRYHRRHNPLISRPPLFPCNNLALFVAAGSRRSAASWGWGYSRPCQLPNTSPAFPTTPPTIHHRKYHRVLSYSIV